MNLQNKNHFTYDEYVCELTKELDILAKILDYRKCGFYHYIVADDYCKKEKCLAIRVPGGTVGSIWIDHNNVITKIVVDTDYVVKTYPDNVNEIIQKFIGEVIEW